VGATTKTDEIAYFSSRGPTSDWRIKPDVLAPGVDIVAGRASGTSMGSPIDEFYTSASGTSMATPHVSGAAALLLQVDRTQRPEQIKARLMNSARELANLDVWAQGSGRIDCYRAATAEARLSPTSWSFGQLSSLQVTSTSISIMNYGRSPVSFAVTTSTTVDGLPTGYVSTSTSNGTLNGLQELLFSLSVGPFNSTTPEGWFEGWLEVKLLTDPAQELHMPYLFILASTLEVIVYDVDGSPVEALVTAASYPGISGATSLYTSGQGPARLSVKSGDYAVFAELAWVKNDPRRMFALESRVTVPRLSTARASFSLGEARVCSISTTSSVGEDLTVHAYMQMLSGGTPAWDTYWQSNFMEWGTASGWFGFDLASDKLTFYTTTYDPADRVSLNLGFYASDALHSEVQLMPFKFWNIADLPSIIAYPKDQLATWDIFFDVPETYPTMGLRIMNAFWFTWDYTGLGFQLWGWDLHEIYGGIESKYLLGPGVQWPWLLYLPTYADHEFHNPGMGPLQEIHINDWNYPLIPSPSNRPPAEGQNGSIRAGDFEFAPYAPGLLLSASQGQIRITGDVWRDLTWPRLDWHTQTSGCGGLDGPVSPYPRKNPAYELRVDGLTVEQGELSGRDYVTCLEADLFGADWTGIDKSWAVAGGEVTVVTLLPAMGVLTSESSYTLRLDLSSGDLDAPEMTRLTYPRSYVLGQEIQVLIDSNDASSGITTVEVLFSYDGTTWKAASYDGGIATFTVDYDGSDSIDLLVRVKDNSGNYVEFINCPAMLNAKAIMRVEQPANVLPGSSAIIGGNLTTTEGKPIHGLALGFSSNSTSHYLSVNQGEITQFRLVVPSTVQCEMVLAPVGLYRGESVGFTIEVANQYNVTVFTRRVDGLALSGVQVTFGSETKTTDSSGKAEFSVPRGTYALSVQSPLTAGSGIQHILSLWADGASGNPRSVTVNASAAFDVRYKTQYQLTMQVDPSASAVTIPSVGIHWYDSGQTVDIQASPASGYIFRSWAGSGSGSYTGTVNPASVTMNAPVREVASLANQNGVMISGVSVVPDPVIQGFKVVFNLRVVNLGTSKVSSLKVQLAINRPDGSLAWSKSASISSLYAGAQKTIRVTYTVPASAPAGVWTYSVYLYQGKVLLDQKTDGSFTVDPRVIAGSIVSVSDSPDPVARGKTVTFAVTVKNTGNIVWPAVITIKIYRPDGALTATRTLTGKKLQPNVEYTYRITWKAPSRTEAGVFHYEVYLKHGSILIGSSTDPGSTIRVN
jgi:hypothetical protein